MRQGYNLSVLAFAVSFFLLSFSHEILNVYTRQAAGVCGFWEWGKKKRGKKEEAEEQGARTRAVALVLLLDLAINRNSNNNNIAISFH
jgi:hypothetical protein